MFDKANIMSELVDYFDDWFDKFDVDSITDELIEAGARKSIDDVPYDEFVTIVRKYSYLNPASNA